MRLRCVTSSVSVVALFALSACGTTTTAAEDERTTEAAAASQAPAGGFTDQDAAGATRGGGTQSGGTQDGKDLPASLDFSSETVEGAAYSGAQLAGRPAVLWFWAPWCPTCRGQIDDVSAAADQYGQDVAFVGVGSLDGGEAIADFADDVPSDEVTQLTDPDGSVWRHFAITEQSTYVVLDADGAIVSSGYLDEGQLLATAGDLAAG